jgi:hypothetical protein
MDQDFGLERSWRERVSLKYSHFEFDDYGPPSKRTIAQKFEIQAKIAANKLIDLKLLDNEEAENFLTNFIKEISIKTPTLNGGAFALVFLCMDWQEKKIYMTRKKDKFSWQDLIEIMSKPNSRLSSYIKEYGITISDLVRYVIYTRNFFSILD